MSTVKFLGLTPSYPIGRAFPAGIQALERGNITHVVRDGVIFVRPLDADIAGRRLQEAWAALAPRAKPKR